jgi:GH24 family phage-related lysozyme (muramidase)
VNDFTDLKNSLKNYEGCIEYMYLDTRGNVTVGVGHLLGSCGDAETLSFVIRESGAGASAADILSEFNRVKAQRAGESASAYRGCTQLNMPVSAIEALLDADIATAEAGMRQRFGNFDSYPVEAQSALLDMAFNLGLEGLATGYPRLRAAAEAGDWNTCAEQCFRHGIQQARNDWTKQQFEKAAQASANSANA